MIKILESTTKLNPSFKKFSNLDYADYSEACILPDGEGPFLCEIDTDTTTVHIVLSGNCEEKKPESYNLEVLTDHDQIPYGKTSYDANKFYSIANRTVDVIKKYSSDSTLKRTGKALSQFLDNIYDMPDVSYDD